MPLATAWNGGSGLAPSEELTSDWTTTATSKLLTPACGAGGTLTRTLPSTSVQWDAAVPCPTLFSMGFAITAIGLGSTFELLNVPGGPR